MKKLIILIMLVIAVPSLSWEVTINMNTKNVIAFEPYLTIFMFSGRTSSNIVKTDCNIEKRWYIGVNINFNVIRKNNISWSLNNKNGGYFRNGNSEFSAIFNSDPFGNTLFLRKGSPYVTFKGISKVRYTQDKHLMLD